MATHSNTLAWRIPWTEEPRGLPSMGSHRVGQDWHGLAAAAATFLGLPWWLSGKESACNARDSGNIGLIPGWGRSPRGKAWWPTPLFLPGDSRGQRSLVGYSPQGHKQSDTTELTEHTHTHTASFPEHTSLAEENVKNFQKEAFQSTLL